MTTSTKKRMGVVGVLVAVAVFAIGGTAYADGKDKGSKEGCGKRADARFEKSDANSDGFLTEAEVGDKKWARIKVADANNDAKVSLAEMKLAKADGKLKHKDKKGKKGKQKGSADA